MTDLAPASLDPALLQAIVRPVLDTLPIDPNASPADHAAQQQAALAAITALQPRDPWEAMLAVRAVAAHLAVLEALRRAVQPEVADAMAIRLRSNAVALTRMISTTLRELGHLPPRASSRQTAMEAAAEPSLYATPEPQSADQAGPAPSDLSTEPQGAEAARPTGGSADAQPAVAARPGAAAAAPPGGAVQARPAAEDRPAAPRNMPNPAPHPAPNAAAAPAACPARSSAEPIRGGRVAADSLADRRPAPVAPDIHPHSAVALRG